MFARHRIKYWITAATLAATVLIAFFFFYPGFHNYDPPPETIGADVIVSGFDFSSGDHEATGVSETGAVGQALVLDIATARGAYTAQPVQADYTFSALGLHWLADTPQGTGIETEVRFSQDGDQWGDWQKVIIDVGEAPEHISETKSSGETIGQLVFAEGEARYFQYRMFLTANAAGETPSVTRMTASYIDARGYHESPVSVEKIWSRVSAAARPEPANADPGIISRAAWGANEAYMTWPPSYVTPRKIIIHHTVTSNYDPDPAATVRSIYYYHAVSLGWGDIGYNYLIDRQGRIFEGRYGGNGAVGGHALTWNPGSIGISALGNYEEVGPTPEMYNAFVALMTSRSNLNLIDPYGNDYLNGTYSPNFLGHRDVYSTACPGQYLYPYLPYFRTAAHDGYSPIPIIGAIRIKWDQLNGAPGGAVSQEQDIPGVPGGRYQNFQSGRIIWTPTGGTNWVCGAILYKYDTLGREAGVLGLPISDEYGIAGGRASNFTGGKIYWSLYTGAHMTNGAIMSKMLADGGPARFGFPTSDEYDVPGISGAKGHDFQGGRFYWTVADGTHVTVGAIMLKYISMGGPATFGLPTTDEYVVTGVAGACGHDFTNGRIYWSLPTGPRAISGAISTKYMSMGGPAIYGLPLTDEYAANGGRAQNLRSAVITWSEADGAHATYGGIMGRYLSLGGPTGFLGMATTDEIDAPGVTGARESDFKGGRIYWSAPIGCPVIYGAILQRYLDIGASEGFGIPVSDEYGIAGLPGGRVSDFQRGKIYWTATAGAHEMYGAIMNKWLQYGGAPGFLGMPNGDELDAPGVPGARERDFVGGHIYWSASTGVCLVNGAIFQKFIEYGGSASALGIPISDEFNWGNGKRTNFQGGYILWDQWTGAHVFVAASGTEVTADTNFDVTDASGTLLVTLAAGQTANVTYLDGLYYVRTSTGYSHVGSSQVRMTASNGTGIMQVNSFHDHPAWNPSLDDNRFRGTIEVRYSPVSNAVWVINDLPLEYYLRGIAESSSGSPAEYLKTMTVAARDYALWHLNAGGKNYGSGPDIFHLKNSRNGNGDDQQYRGYGLEARFPDLTTAIDATTGQVVTYGGNLALATYFSNSDGRTRSAQEAWGTTSWPWLASVPDPDCDGMTLNGHGVGISGTGALARANRGNTYQQILTYYYTGTVVQAMDTNKNIRVAIMRI
jgi:uncharacterized protein with LGFP repeats